MVKPSAKIMSIFRAECALCLSVFCDFYRRGGSNEGKGVKKKSIYDHRWYESSSGQSEIGYSSLVPYLLNF